MYNFFIHIFPPLKYRKCDKCHHIYMIYMLKSIEIGHVFDNICEITHKSIVIRYFPVIYLNREVDH